MDNTEFFWQNGCRIAVNEVTTSDAKTEQLFLSHRYHPGESSETPRSVKDGYDPARFLTPTTTSHTEKDADKLEADLAKEYELLGAIRQVTEKRAPSNLRYHRYADEPYKSPQQYGNSPSLRAPRAEKDIPSSESIFPDGKSDKLLDGSRFWALIISIDKYESRPLQGCVNDGKSMKEYFTKDLGVPEQNVRCLFNESATRAAIVSALCSILSDTRILNGDIIIIYFAGHGSSYTDLGHSSGEYDCVEAICPVDRGTHHNERTVPDLSDREFNSILSLISRAKGHRITVLFDCCHSGGLTRYSVLEGIRTIPPLKRDSAKDMLHMADENLKHYPGYRSVLNSDWHPDMDCHVILAAAREYEYAREVEGENGFHGVFTYSLLRALRAAPLEIPTKQLTYDDLLHTMPVSYYQTPVVAGCRQSTRVWYQD